MTRTARAAALLSLPLLLALAGCGGSDDEPAPRSALAESSSPASPSPTEASRPSTSPSASPTAAASVPFQATTGADDGGLGSGNGLTLTGVRVARNPGFDRVVFDLGGTGTPGWRVEYTKQPAADGSGEPVRLKGDVYLQVVLHGLGQSEDTGVTSYGDSSTRVPGTGTKGVAEIAPGGVFEGDQLAFIGLDGAQRPFRVFALRNPTRVVVDVRDR